MRPLDPRDAGPGTAIGCLLGQRPRWTGHCNPMVQLESVSRRKPYLHPTGERAKSSRASLAPSGWQDGAGRWAQTTVGVATTYLLSSL